MNIPEHVEICCRSDCGIPFAVSLDFHKRKKNDHTSFYCPNGHGQHYSGESAEEALRRERDLLRQRVAQRDDEIREVKDARARTERSLKATKAVVTRIKNRIGHGVCPCCSRSFQNLQRHMETQHLGYAKEAAE